MYQLAQLNIATALHDMESTNMSGFVQGLDPVNQTAEAAEGFIWRLQDESGNATNIQYFDDPKMLVNMSVWRDIECLKHFMFKTHHRHFMQQRSQWFEQANVAKYVLWWVKQGHIPDLHEAMDKLSLLRQCRPAKDAFSFSNVFPAPKH